MKPCLLLLAAGLLAGGCATTVNTVERAQPQAAPSYVADKRVVTDNSLAATFRVASVNQATVSGNLLKVQVAVENMKSSTKALSYKFEWVDASGMSIDSPNETWKQVRIQPRETITLSTVSINPRAVDFVLKLKE
ncbi:MAG TPA: YcfL family protein [Opitutus sp.]|nr:YcfL family protein [Opitutus sp.]